MSVGESAQLDVACDSIVAFRGYRTIRGRRINPTMSSEEPLGSIPEQAAQEYVNY